MLSLSAAKLGSALVLQAPVEKMPFFALASAFLAELVGMATPFVQHLLTTHPTPVPAAACDPHDARDEAACASL